MLEFIFTWKRKINLINAIVHCAIMICLKTKIILINNDFFEELVSANADVKNFNE